MAVRPAPDQLVGELSEDECRRESVPKVQKKPSHNKPPILKIPS
jgi:hypothetical protein